MKERLYNYDVLRIFSCIAVITIHVSQLWVKYVDTTMDVSFQYNVIGVMFINSLAKFAVPLFLMLGGVLY